MATATQLDPILEAIRTGRAAYTSIFAAFTILLYDCILTFEKEITFIWKESHCLTRTPWTIPKFLYLFAKYYGLAHVGSILISAFTLVCKSTFKLNGNPDQFSMVQIIPQSCKNYLGWMVILLKPCLTPRGGPVVFTTSINLILGLRLYALYQSSNWEKFAGLIRNQAEFWGSYKNLILETGVPFVDLDALTPFMPNIKQVFPGCAFGVLPASSFTLAAYIPTLIVSGIFFGMMAFKCFEYAPWGSWFPRWGLKANQNADIPKIVSTPGNIIFFFIRDGAVFFFLVFSTVLVTLMILTFQLSSIGISAVPSDFYAYN
ncbi:hypothetical protein GYMLUDRAFT_58967 [Collybiopsis luxurians FD-317 M1]|uniref:DUF6533 domain-containing protein n=1 Tax=Collybiopsis luxurians FD-317 M1 TaxID=944289 RepID=A0A0D0BZX3_9AGAR|nr:hypothetical protein GYMLUDRAFT_58967 [Collybiopsis luxurians FD-317 M1]